VRAIRPGRPSDLSSLRTLWVSEVRQGQRDCVPSARALEGLVEAVDWATCSRVIEDEDGVRAIGLVLKQSTQEGVVTRVEIAAQDEVERERLLRWGVGFGLAIGASTVEVWRPRAAPRPPEDLGLSAVRPFWRMDRANLNDLPDLQLPPGYRLAPRVDPRQATTVFNQAFHEHWRFQPKEANAALRRPLTVNLLALGPDGSPAGIVWGSLERYEADSRPQPVGLLEAVGTLPEHRRRGVAAGLLVEALRRLRRRGAQIVSLYVDGLNTTGAATVYHRLGFQIGFEYEVFEATPTSLASRLRRLDE
jgi:ribosomal protein S18 acetylase RimI-like enzyme